MTTTTLTKNSQTSAVELAEQADAELARLQAPIDDLQKQIAEKQALKRNARTREEFAFARDELEWFEAQLAKAKEAHAARTAELAPALQARTVHDAERRVEEAKQAYREYFDRLGEHRAKLEEHITGIFDTIATVRRETDEQARHATYANSKAGKITENRAPKANTQEAFRFLNDRIRQLLDGGTQLHFPQD